MKRGGAVDRLRKASKRKPDDAAPKSTDPDCVVHVITAPAHVSKTLLTPENAFEQFLAPLAPSEFLSHIYRRRCLVVHGGGLGRLASMCEDGLYGLDLHELAAATASGVCCGAHTVYTYCV